MDGRDSPMGTIAFRQRLIEDPCRILLNPLHRTTKLDIGIGILHIGDRRRDTQILPNILIFLAIGGMREFEIGSIPHKPHGR